MTKSSLIGKVTTIGLFVFTCAQSGNAFVAGLELYELADNLVLFVGDRHIETQDAPQALLQKELYDIQAFNVFINKLVQEQINHDWVLESSESTLATMAQDADKSELLFSVPSKVSQVLKRQRDTAMRGFFSDYRRAEIKDGFLSSHTILRMLLETSAEFLSQRNAWTKADRAWLDAHRSPVDPSELTLKLDFYIKSNAAFREMLFKSLDRMLSIILNGQSAMFGRKTTFRTFKEKFSRFQDELTNFQTRNHDISKSNIAVEMEQNLHKCQATLRSFMELRNLNDSSGLYQALFAEIKKTRSLRILGEIDSTELADCSLHILADAGFLLDLLQSQAEKKATIVFAGGTHAAKLAADLQSLGYKKVFKEGELRADRGVTTMNAFVEKDTPIDNKVLSRRLNEMLEMLNANAVRQEL